MNENHNAGVLRAVRVAFELTFGHAAILTDEEILDVYASQPVDDCGAVKAADDAKRAVIHIGANPRR